MLVFAGNPFEQALVVVALCSFGVRAKAILARHSSIARADLQRRFNRPFSYWATGGTAFDRTNDIEVLVMNFQMSGFNL